MIWMGKVAVQTPANFLNIVSTVFFFFLPHFFRLFLLLNLQLKALSH